MPTLNLLLAHTMPRTPWPARPAPGHKSSHCLQGKRQTQSCLSLQDCNLCLIKTKQTTNKGGCLWDTASQAANS